jgi:hypothetical protein
MYRSYSYSNMPQATNTFKEKEKPISTQMPMSQKKTTPSRKRKRKNKKITPELGAIFVGAYKARC